MRYHTLSHFKTASIFQFPNHKFNKYKEYLKKIVISFHVKSDFNYFVFGVSNKVEQQQRATHFILLTLKPLFTIK